MRASYSCLNGSSSEDVRDARDSKIELNLLMACGNLIALRRAADMSAQSATDFVVHDKLDQILVDMRSITVSGAVRLRLRPGTAGH